jgi:short-subunit dehydrogenase
MEFAMDARRVAKTGYAAMMKGKRVAIPGALNNIMSFLAKRVPPRLNSAIARRLHSPG